MSDEHKRIFLTPKCMQEHECERMWCEDPQNCDECDSPAVEYVLVSERDAALAEAAAYRQLLTFAADQIATVARSSRLAPEIQRLLRVSISGINDRLACPSPAQELLDKMGRMREALKPFAEAGIPWAKDNDRDDSIWALEPDATVLVKSPCTITVGDLRRAAAVEMEDLAAPAGPIGGVR